MINGRGRIIVQAMGSETAWVILVEVHVSDSGQALLFLSTSPFAFILGLPAPDPSGRWFGIKLRDRGVFRRSHSAMNIEDCEAKQEPNRAFPIGSRGSSHAPSQGIPCIFQVVEYQAQKPTKQEGGAMVRPNITKGSP